VRLSINMVLILFLKINTRGYQPWSWYVFMIVKKILNFKQCPTMNQQKQIMFHNEPIKTKKKQTLALIAH